MDVVRGERARGSVEGETFIPISISEIRVRSEGCASSLDSLPWICGGSALQLMYTLNDRNGWKIFRKATQTPDSARKSCCARSGQIDSQSSVGRYNYHIHQYSSEMGSAGRGTELDLRAALETNLE
jgi:hypothetical protein